MLTLQLRDRMVAIVKEMRCGNAEDYTSFTSAVIDHNVSEQLLSLLCQHLLCLVCSLGRTSRATLILPILTASTRSWLGVELMIGM